MKLSELGEFGLISRIKGHLGADGGQLIRGIGDDAAVIRGGADVVTLATTDMLVEGIHFDLDYMSPGELGEKALAVNVSDIAAMGGIPRWSLLSLGLPADMEVGFLDGFFKGLVAAGNRFGVKLAGGDTVTSGGGMVINIALYGEVAAADVIYRNGASPGDRLFVTGTLGDSASGLELLKKGLRRSSCDLYESALAERHLVPEPRIKESAIVVSEKLASAMMDISDGLLQDLGHICRESGVGAKVLAEKIPLSGAFVEAGGKHGLDKMLSLTGGEDYELLFTVPEEKMPALDSCRHLFESGLSEIGEICEGTEVSVFDEKGLPLSVMQGGYDHFRKELR
ncbi:MAG: thiamine-phosphate kinase [Proteobacteria bacterium]|nr:thiamine-phosphate kinase [Pseudomonadota bacterium]